MVSVSRLGSSGGGARSISRLRWPRVPEPPEVPGQRAAGHLLRQRQELVLVQTRDPVLERGRVGGYRSQLAHPPSEPAEPSASHHLPLGGPTRTRPVSATRSKARANSCSYGAAEGAEVRVLGICSARP